MKQPIDTFTGDMFEEDEVAELSYSGGKKPKYRVFLELDGGTKLVWDCLTRAQALALYKSHDKKFNHIRSSADITRFGWEEMQ